MQPQPRVFNLLAEPVRKVLAELGFSEPTLPQTLAFPAVDGFYMDLLKAKVQYLRTREYWDK